MWKTYIDLAKAYYPKAHIIALRFHYTRYVTVAMDTARREVQSLVGKEYRKYMKHSRKLLLGREEKLEEIKTYDAKEALRERLNLSPKLTSSISTRTIVL